MDEKTIPIIYVNRSMVLPDNNQWRFRFEVRSESSGNVYVVSQNIKYRHWGCSCPGYIRHRKCKHLQALGLPTNEVPFEAQLQSR